VRSALDAFGDARQHNGCWTTAIKSPIWNWSIRQIFRVSRTGRHCDFQLQWAERDPYIVKATLPYLGPERSRYLYPARSLRMPAH